MNTKMQKPISIILSTSLYRQRILDNAENIFSFINENITELNKLNQQYKDFYGADILDSLKQIKEDNDKILSLLKENREKSSMPRQAILSNANVLLRFMDKHQKDFSNLNNIFKEEYNVDMKELVLEIKNDNNYISEIL